MRVDEAHDQQERAPGILVAGPPAGVAILEPRHRPVGEDRVAHQARLPFPAVGFGPDPSREPEGVERVGVEVGLHRALVDDTAVVVGREGSTGRRIGEVGVAHVPLAHVPGVVPAQPEPVAERRYLAGPEPAHPRVVGHLPQAVGLGDAVDVGVLAGEQRGPAGDAGERARVVTPKRHAVVLEPPRPRQLLAAPCRERGRLVGRHRPFLVGHEDDHVGAIAHETAPASTWALSPASI